MTAHSAHLALRKWKAKAFHGVCIMAVLLAIALLLILFGSILEKGFSRIDWSFFTNFPSSNPARAGIRSALMGTIWVIVLTTVIAVPIGVAAAIYLEEFHRKRNRLTQFIQLNISNLAGVPSIIYGLLGLALFVRWLELGRSVIAGALTMSLLILPTIIIVSQEALRAVPNSYREGSYALGAGMWHTIRRQVLPNATPGILTGIILAVSRAMGETAPLITIGAATYVAFVPTGWNDPFTVLPIVIFNWTTRPGKGFAEDAAAASIVLVAFLLVLNSIAIYLRYRAQKRA